MSGAGSTAHEWMTEGCWMRSCEHHRYVNSNVYIQAGSMSQSGDSLGHLCKRQRSLWVALSLMLKIHTDQRP